MSVMVWERTMGALVILLVCLISTTVLADESYLCIGEQGTVFMFNKTNKSWTAENAKPGKWIVKRSTNPEYKKNMVISHVLAPDCTGSS
jgi:hypothetical protein